MKQICDETRWRRQASTVLRTPLLCGALLLYAFALKAQQNTPAPARPVSDSSQKVLCDAAKTAELRRMQRAMEQALTQAMQSPEMQKAMLIVMQDTVQKQGGVPLQVDLNLMAIPDSLRAPFAAAVASRQFDSAKAIARKVFGGTPVESAKLDIAFKLLEILPDTLRALFFAGNAWECRLPGTP